MGTIIVALTALLAIFGSLLQLILVFEGLFLFSSNKKCRWFKLWGVCHIGVLIILHGFVSETLTNAIGAFQSVAVQPEGIRIVAMYLILPLVVSFSISRVYLYIHKH